MRYLTEDQIARVEREMQAQRFADEANALAHRIASAGFVLEITCIAERLGVVTVRERDVHSGARMLAVPA